LVLDDIHKDDEMYKFAEGIRESLNGTYDKNHEIFQRGGVKYILIANASYDNPVKSQEMELITAYLSNLSSKKVIERVAEGKFLTLYRLNVSPLIPDRIEYTRCNNNSTKLNDIYKEIEMYPQIGKAILVCENKTNAVELDSYQILKIVEESPSEYYLDVSTKGKKIAVYLPFRYDPAWKLEITNGKHGSIYHYRTMENMNLWLVEFEELPDLLSLKVKYVTELQNLNDLILMISGLIFAGYLIYLAYNLIKEE